MKPIINWEELQALTLPPMKHMHHDDAERRNNFAAFYNKMASMEKIFTLNQVFALPLFPSETLLDVGCGPGRLSVPLARRVKSVTAIDASEEVLKYCRMNADEGGLTNLTTKKLDFEDAVIGKNIGKHDVVICSRSIGLRNLAKLSTFANRLTAIVSFANAPTIPQLLSNIFKGTSSEDGQRPSFPSYGKDRRMNYNILFRVLTRTGLKK